MEARLLQSCQFPSWIDSEKTMRGPSGFIRVPHMAQQKGVKMFLTTKSNRQTLAHFKPLAIKVYSSLKNSQGSVLESSNSPASLGESLILKNKAVEIEPYLNGRCIYLVGMMGSGKTTIGRLLSEVLGYSFLDSDSLVEEAAGGVSVAEIFKKHGESFFRDKETEVLHKVSVMGHQVISTGGGAVIRPINWRHMRKGISVWLDVPIECLARRISAVGTGSRPLLHGEEGNAYEKAFARLSALFEERHEAYANANVRVSLEYIVAKLGCADADNLSPMVIAVEVLEQIESFLKDDGFAI